MQNRYNGSGRKYHTQHLTSLLGKSFVIIRTPLGSNSLYPKIVFHETFGKSRKKCYGMFRWIYARYHKYVNGDRSTACIVMQTGFKCILRYYIGMRVSLPFYPLLFLIYLFSSYWFVLWGWGVRTDWVSIALFSLVLPYLS